MSLEEETNLEIEATLKQEKSSFIGTFSFIHIANLETTTTYWTWLEKTQIKSFDPLDHRYALLYTVWLQMKISRKIQQIHI